MLYSGTNSQDDLLVKRCRCEYYISSLNIGCLYLGDVSLRKGNCMAMLRKYLGDRIQEVGTIQIPHHGSQDNFNEEILKSGALSVISCDLESYNLPSISVMKSIITAGSQLFIVTDKKETELKEKFVYK